MINVWTAQCKLSPLAGDSGALINGIFCGPPSGQPLSDGSFIDVTSPRPLRNAFGFTIDRDDDGVSSVVHLLGFCGPLAVLGGVVAIVVNSINRVRGTRPDSNVANKCGKAVNPSAANCYPSSAVIAIAFVARVVAPAFHCLPGVVFRGVRGAMRCFAVTETSAGLSDPSSSVAVAGNMLSAAVAKEKPKNAVAGVFSDWCYGFEFMKLLTRDVFRSLGKLDWCKMHLSHCLDSFKMVVRGLPVGAGSSRQLYPVSGVFA